MKKLFFLIVVVSTFFTGKAQVEFHQGVGVGYLGNFSGGASASAVEVNYHPRITFLHKGKFSLGAGIPFGVGYQFSGNALLVDVPAMFDFNFGQGHSEENESKFGAYGGVGFRYILSAFFGDVSGTANQYGPAVHAGARMGIGDGGSSIGLGLNYAYDLNFSSNFIGAGVMYNFN
jgi:hypothetical protein